MSRAGRSPRKVASKGRIAKAWDVVSSQFGVPAGVAMLTGLGLGLALPWLDSLAAVEIPTFSFDGQDAARGLLETVATVTVAVAGLSFSVTVVAFTLASSQLSPRVLRSFQRDRLSQLTLALFLGTFVYCLVVLTRLGVLEDGSPVPNVAITFALVLALAAFGLFAAFVAHIVSMLEPSAVIASIAGDAERAAAAPYPSQSAGEPEHPARAAQLARALASRAQARPVEAEGHGYLTLVDVEAIIELMEERDGLCRQSVPLGDYVVPGQQLAELHVEGVDDDLVRSVRASFTLGRQRSLVQDTAFPIRQLADIALKGLSPGVNDPTTAENAIDAMTAILCELARGQQPAATRVADDGTPRFLATAPDLDSLIRVGFEQVRVFAKPYPVVSAHLAEQLRRIESAAARRGRAVPEVTRQLALIAEAADDELPTAADRKRVRAAAAG